MELIEAQNRLFTRICNAVSNFKKLGQQNMNKGGCVTRMDQLKEIWQKFDENHSQLCESDEVSADEGYFKEAVYEKAEEKYLANLGAFRDYLLQLERLESTTAAASQTVISPGITPQPLPTPALPTFSGEVKDWVRFRDNFQEMVVKRTNLANVYKMNYLISSLKGEAAELIAEIPAGGDNFADAWRTVTNYYDNKRLLITKLLTKLFSMPAMAAETAHEVSRISVNTKNLLQALKLLGSPTEHWDHIIVFLTVSRLTPTSQRRWEEFVSRLAQPHEPPTFANLESFLESERLSMTQLESSKAVATKDSGERNFKRNWTPKNNVKTVLVAGEEGRRTSTCALCKANHFIMNCKAFLEKNPTERKQIVTQKKLCFNCLSSHAVRECQNSKRCQVCSGKHHTLLHYKAVDQSPDKTGGSKSTEGNGSKNDTAHLQLEEGSMESALAESERGEIVLLATAWVYVQSSRGAEELTRVLVDQGAQSSFISEGLCQYLSLKKSPVRVRISGVGNGKTLCCRSTVEFILKPHFLSTFSCRVKAYVIPTITSYQPFADAGTSWPHLQGLTLADLRFGRPDKIDILLGAQVHALIVEEGLRKAERQPAPIATKTLLGWIVSGPTSIGHHDHLSPVVSHLETDVELNTLLRSFWEVEEAPHTKLVTDEEKECEEFYVNTVKRDKEGRYVVRLPLKSDAPKFWGNSYTLAVRALHGMEQRFRKNSALKKSYSAQMREYIQLGHMKRVLDRTLEVERCFFIPHHPVFKENSTTTQCRAVNNASKKTNLGFSLNDFLLVGRNLLPEIIDLLTRWRKYIFVFAADIEKMFRQIGVHEEDQHLQAIVWRGEEEEEIGTYFLTTVTFGLGCSPFLASRTLQQLGVDEGRNYPLAAQVVKEEIYMDDVLSGGYEIQEAQEKQRQVNRMLRSGGFNLRKWLANDARVTQEVPMEDRAAIASLKVGAGFAVLGIAWDPQVDCFYFNIALETLEERVTKRTVLSKISKLYDPLGWISPIIITLKIFMQSLWALTKEWDCPLPQEYVESWYRMYSSLQPIESIRISRWIGVGPAAVKYELHGFADASKLAYAAVVYLRVLGDSAQVFLLSAKTKVAPTKTLSIPRLELCAAQLLARLVRHLVGVLQLPHVHCHLWSDAKDVLYWLRDIPSKWPTFVANRCADIHTRVPDAYWHHIQSADNPADIASRGSLAADLKDNQLWWKGPKRLWETSREWTSTNDLEVNREDVESAECEEDESRMGAVEVAAMVASSSKGEDSPVWDLVDRYSSLSKLSRISVYIFRFIRKILAKVSFQERVASIWSDFPLPSQEITIRPEELRQAKLIWSYLTQRSYFAAEKKMLQEGRELPKSHAWRSLNPTLSGCLVRVGGRLRHAILEADEKFPVILPLDSVFTRLVVDYFHSFTLHGGAQLTLTNIRSQFWIVRGKIAVKKFIRNCVKCNRYQASKPYQLMGDLPRYRVEPARPSLHSGVDYAGPFLIRSSRLRGNKAYKGYIAIFVCMCTKAVHLELVSGYDSEAFIAAFSRFVARRGPCAKLFSDQGTTFVGADAELKSMFRKGTEFCMFVERKLSEDGTQWHFNPPAAPHFGDIWEAAVKSVKHHLKRVVGETKLTFEEMYSLLCRVEACLNSRPLLPLTDDPTDLAVLTPAHFLIGNSSILFVEPRIVDEVVPPLKRWRRVTQMTQHLWDRWSHEYLQQLQRRVKWKTQREQPKIGDLVLLRHETTPPSRWPLGRIIEMHPGKDGLVRVATVRTANTTLQRPIVKLVILRSEDEPQ